MAAVVEKWNPHARIRQDLFGVLDIVGCKRGETIGVQSTSAYNVASRLHKLEDSEAPPRLREAGWTVLVHGWRKNPKGRWICREVNVS